MDNLTSGANENLHNMINFFDIEYFNNMDLFQKNLDASISNSTTADVFSLESIKKEFLIFKTNICDQLKILQQFMVATSSKLDELEMYSRRNCLLIHGIPECVPGGKEDISKVVAETVAKLKIKDWNFNATTMIDRCHRLGPRSTKGEHSPRPIIVKFATYNYRQFIWCNKKFLDGSKIIITESLTKRRHSLFTKSRLVFGDKNVWSVDGRIMAKHSDGAITHIKSEEHLNKFVELEEDENEMVDALDETKATAISNVYVMKDIFTPILSRPQTKSIPNLLLNSLQSADNQETSLNDRQIVPIPESFNEQCNQRSARQSKFSSKEHSTMIEIVTKRRSVNNVDVTKPKLKYSRAQLSTLVAVPISSNAKSKQMIPLKFIQSTPTPMLTFQQECVKPFPVITTPNTESSAFMSTTSTSFSSTNTAFKPPLSSSRKTIASMIQNQFKK